jgi:hypothetical protein
VVITAASSLSSARTWTGQNGSTVEAEFVSVSGEQVELKKEDGKTVNVPIGKLCAEDRQYIQDRIRATEEKTAGQSLYFALKLEFSTDSQAAAINIQPPWGSKVIRRSARYPDIDEENDKRKEKGVPPIIIPLLDGMTVKRSANPLLEEEEESYPELTVEYILYVEASENADFKFTIDKTPVGSVSLKISGFDPKTEKAKRIRTFKNTSDKEKEYTLELSKIESACNHFDYSPTPK